eukprot:4595868-Pyramimonas_sp.AAC.1
MPTTASTATTGTSPLAGTMVVATPRRGPHSGLKTVGAGVVAAVSCMASVGAGGGGSVTTCDASASEQQARVHFHRWARLDDLVSGEIRPQRVSPGGPRLVRMTNGARERVGE